MLRFLSGTVANCTTSYGAHECKDLRVRLEKGWIDLENAFAYVGQQMQVAHRGGKAEIVERVRLPQQNQFALEIDHMASSVKENRTLRTPGQEGVQDHVLMEALYEPPAPWLPYPLSRWPGGTRPGDRNRNRRAEAPSGATPPEPGGSGSAAPGRSAGGR